MLEAPHGTTEQWLYELGRMWNIAGTGPLSLLRLQSELCPIYWHLQGLFQSTSTSEIPKGRYTYALSDSMPIHCGALIWTERGVQGLVLDEFCRGLGYLKSEAADVSPPVTMHTTLVFHWELLSTALSGCPAKVAVPLSTTTESPQAEESRSDPPKDPSNFSWTPPDLAKGGNWFLQRIKNLRAASES